MKFILKETQLDVKKFQNLIDRCLENIYNDCNNHYTKFPDFCDKLFFVKRIQVVNVFKEEYFRISVLLLVEPREEQYDYGDILTEIQIELSEYIDKSSFKIVLLNVLGV